MSVRLLIRDHPDRAVALATSTHVLTFKHSNHISARSHNGFSSRNSSRHSLEGNAAAPPRYMVEFLELAAADLSEYRSLSSLSALGTLGLITVAGDVFLCVVSAASKVATVRPGETVQRILAVDFHCLNRTDYDHVLYDEINPYPTDTVGDDGFDYGHGGGRREPVLEHPCLALKKLLSSGTFYYSADFDLTSRLQDRLSDASTVAVSSLDAGFLWNSYMIQPLVEFRSRLTQREQEALDSSRILTSAIRGFVSTINIPASSSPARASQTGLPSMLTLISRLSCRRAGTRFNARGIDDDGNVANYVETETVFWSPSGVCFSYAQTRGSVPVFWEQATGLLPGQQKISITRSPEATQPALDKHFEYLETKYGAVHVVNLLSNDRSSEAELSDLFQYHIAHSSLSHGGEKGSGLGHELLKQTNYDFHAETRGPGGYEAASAIRHYIQQSADSFAYFLLEEAEERAKSGQEHVHEQAIRRLAVVLQQEGIFRTNCLDCLDRTNLVQTMISQMAIASFLQHRGERGTPDFWVRHSTLWADNGDALSKIYAGTGALKSSFTRHGKMSLAGALADARKSATRMYINNFADKGRQNTIDMLLGRLMGQTPVHLYDPINDYVTAELSRRQAKAREYSSTAPIKIWVGTFNLNGRSLGLNEDLSSWLCPEVDPSQEHPELVAVGFQEIVELSPQQIMSTDPAPRQAWEDAVKRTLNEHAQKRGQEDYVLLRGGQLVGASLSIFAKASVLKHIKNVQGSLKKTGMSGMAGNKGAVAIRMDYANTSICFVTAHLAAGFANYEERNRDYNTINHGLRFQSNRSIDDHDAVIWLGDFNYRIGLADERVRKLIHVGDLETLYENDQLNIQMGAALTFPYYSEAPITFLPTYRFDVGTDTYDTSEKHRIPAWCDRILRKGDNLRQINYKSAPIRCSDHKPVYATFVCTITIVDEKTRDTLAAELYKRRRATVGDSAAGKERDESEDDSLAGYNSAQSGLPPASSDRRKWWLDNGLPARSTVQPPSQDFRPNPKRPSNPFTPSTEPDWVRVSQSSQPRKPVNRTPSWKSEANVSLSASSNPRTIGATARKLPPAYVPSQSTTSPPPSSSRRFPERTMQSAAAPNLLFRSQSVSSIRSAPASSTVSRKPAPPVPKKPSKLSSSVNPAALELTPSTSSFPQLPSDARPSTKVPSPKPNQAPEPPPPRRSATQATNSSSRPMSDVAPAALASKPSKPPVSPPERVIKPAQRPNDTSNGTKNSSQPPKAESDPPRVSKGQSAVDAASSPPSLPPRRPTGGLLDQRDDAGMASVQAWQALKPA